MLACIDLVAAEAVYHDHCFSRFMLKKDLDKRNAGGKDQDGGRHQDENLMHWLGLLIGWLESESGAELYTLSELHSKMIIKSTYFLLLWRDRLQKYGKLIKTNEDIKH